MPCKRVAQVRLQDKTVGPILYLAARTGRAIGRQGGSQQRRIGLQVLDVNEFSSLFFLVSFAAF